jgi:hypothetical protein
VATRLDVDRELSSRDVQALESGEAVAGFFTALGYDASSRVEQTAAAMGITQEAVARKIRRIERIADEDHGALQVYVYELDSVTVAARREIARALRDRAGDYLLVLTSDYEMLDFVLIERERVPPAASGPATPRVRVRPRALTVERRNPSEVALRVLRRFTNTEADAYAQYDKLRSAYDVAEWSEPYFNNRGLFADYYLTERLPEEREWQEDPKPTYLRLQALYREARQRVAGQDEATARQELIEPTLRELGFAWTTEQGRARTNEYFLQPSGEAPPVACLAYVWDRTLDGKDEQRGGERAAENPGAVVVGDLDAGAAAWAIVTNGKVWRLYAAQAHSRATNYYEIDLEEALAARAPEAGRSGDAAWDRGKAFRYFWLLFRAAAFEPREARVAGDAGVVPFVERLLLESGEYAKELGERLKERVFEEVFPDLARGFIAYMGHADGRTAAALGEDELRQVFRGTLTLLYRLLFLLYAEARDLLPAREARGYHERSLSQMKGEVAAAAGPIKDQVAPRLERVYAERATATGLYDRLQELARIVNRGDASVNMPAYNGGLFATEVGADDARPEAEVARFLGRYKVPDGYLARALDRLARDLDAKRQDLAFIDYKSLGVRQLGSIYEGLLEFHLRVASERLAVVRQKKVEVYVPAREATGKSLRIVEPGEVYLANDRRERKASGSYYTPDHIVKYIMEHAVGPVLAEHLEGLRERLREVERAHAEAKKRQAAFQQKGMAGDDPEKVATDLRWRGVVDDLFAFRVLDPAMGSGHFLVEAVDFVTDKLLKFLNAFPWNPVDVHLRQTREAILAELERQGITIDAAKLTDVNLLKRHILKRCIYGVDLNPMAVELAKVSLWLDCFTLGAPLSFLDHHLRPGNSLVGARVDEVRAAIEGTAAGHQQLSLFSQSRFAGIMLATDLMRHVGRLPDLTPQQAAESQREYARAAEALAPFKRILDVYLSRWFGNQRTAGKGRNVLPTDPAMEFLRDDAARVWLSQPASALLQDTAAPPLTEEQAVVARTALADAAGWRFLHWELEFPDAYYEPPRGPGEGVERRRGPAFNAVIGNPPYLGVRTGSHDAAFSEYAHRRFTTAAGNWDIFGLFLERFLGQEVPCGAIGMIVPSRASTNRDFSAVRDLFYERGGPSEVIECGAAFEDPTVVAAIIVDVPVDRHRSVIVGPLGDDGVLVRRSLPRTLLMSLPDRPFTSNITEEQAPVFGRLTAAPRRLRDYLAITRGMECGKNDPEVAATAGHGLVPVISGEAIRAFKIVPQGMFIRLGLEPRSKYKDPQLFLQVPKLVIRFVAPYPIAVVDEYGYANFNTVYNGHPADHDSRLCYALACLLNSRVVRWWFMTAYNADESLFPHIQKYQLDLIPVPDLDLDNRVGAQLVELGRRLTADEVEGDSSEIDALAAIAYGVEDCLLLIPNVSAR